jgi:hypothetical protein
VQGKKVLVVVIYPAIILEGFLDCKALVVGFTDTCIKELFS